MTELLDLAIKDCNKYQAFFCKFLSANDAGSTGSHQAGIYMPQNAYEIMFDTPGEKGQNKDRYIEIRWQNDFTTKSRFIYYGQKTRNEYRITRFGRGFPFLSDSHIGDLFILVQAEPDYYLGYLLSSDDEIDSFLEFFGMSPSDTNRFIKNNSTVENEGHLFSRYISNLEVDFPETKDLAEVARKIYYKVYDRKKAEEIDDLLLNWLEMEYSLFRAIERDRYSYLLSESIASIEEYINQANKILNRRKSRAGKSLEHHLTAIFNIEKIPFSSQAVTEGSKKPDFIFPGAKAYHDKSYDRSGLIFLGAKTTCKDRWRQILNEADEIKVKHLFTLQQGISENQLNEMYCNNVVLVVPRKYISTFPKTFRHKIFSLESFIDMARIKLELKG
ncbi:type II restriction endonuclease [Dethiobacter alkaliphilus]|uniref:type II restriction endonuclease n=1 Tax=Dethiobacter alkaliphilus TaxID=427926 RepID=UPI00222727D3|nr:type II restriction endonuclease [Dethiobacter alkaliphilus]MCW3490229.1 type II restriction endonuclease [Dethiobacter alkaliphilus]